MDRDVLKQLATGVLDGGHIEKTPDGKPVDTITLYKDDKSYSDSVKVLAFQLWAFESAQNIEHTRDILQDRIAIDVGANTLRQWRDEGQWREILSDVHQSLSSSALSQVRASLTLGTVNAVRWLISVFDKPDISDTVKLRAAMTLLDRGGFPTLVRGEFLASHHVDSSEWANVTDAELEERIYRYSRDGETIPPDPDQNDERLAMFSHNETSLSSAGTSARHAH